MVGLPVGGELSASGSVGGGVGDNIGGSVFHHASAVVPSNATPRVGLDCGELVVGTAGLESDSIISV